MPTTLTLELDVAVALQTESRLCGRSVRDIMNAILRRGLLLRQPQSRCTVTLPVFSMGLKPGIDLDNAERVLDEAERGLGE